MRSVRLGSARKGSSVGMADVEERQGEAECRREEEHGCGEGGGGCWCQELNEAEEEVEVAWCGVEAAVSKVTEDDDEEEAVTKEVEELAAGVLLLSCCGCGGGGCGGGGGVTEGAVSGAGTGDAQHVVGGTKVAEVGDGAVAVDVDVLGGEEVRGGGVGGMELR
jgi:hypothetical protein